MEACKLLCVFLIAVVFESVQGAPVSTRCVDSCRGVADGDYQSCKGCNVYASCSNGILYDERPCAEDNLFWDDISKRCEWTSRTCGGAPGHTTNNPTVIPGQCVSDCSGMANGDYQSCISCYVFMTCSNGINHDNRPCPDDLVWDDTVKRCEWKSETCGTEGSKTTKAPPPPTHPPGICVSNCKGMANGDYQSCKGCNVYASCSNGILYDERPCAEANLFWDDISKTCEWTSRTCSGPEPTPTKAPPTSTTTKAPPPPTHPPGVCVSNCKGMANGDYQSCKGCNVYASCSNGILYDERPCAEAYLFWDDISKTCEWTSRTCSGPEPTPTKAPPPSTTTKAPPPPTHPPGVCVSNCKGMANGDYQSCKGCNVYASCSNGILYDERPCAEAYLFWDDISKTCEWTSRTCSGPVPTNAPPPTHKPGDCVSDCKDMANGDYQSCKGCHVYMTCSNGINHDNRPCPADLVWDDNVKRCEWESTTCDIPTTTIAPTPSTTTKTPPPPTHKPGDCVSDCKDMANGDYQSCKGCHVYMTCSNGINHDNRPCPADLVWDDNVKRCEWESTTCDIPTTTIAPTPSTTTKTPPPPTHKPGDCVSDCKDMANGDYQSCKGCHVYMTCSNGINHDNRPCPADLVWDDNVKRCEWESTTCDIPTTTIAPTPSTTTKTPPPPTHKPGDCVSDCKDMANGDYQSCKGCHVYMTCSNGINHDNRPCPADLVWDDNVKRCEWESTTCDIPTTTIAPTPSTTTKTPPPPTHKPGDCVSDCKDMANGDYQSCKGCHVYMTCSNGINHDNRPCPADLVWDDNVKRCEWESTTCDIPTTTIAPTPSTTTKTPPPPTHKPGDCVSDCKDMANGDYQSCKGCHVYMTCSNGINHDNRPCPADLVWDDNVKRCEWESTTCDIPTTTIAPTPSTTTKTPPPPTHKPGDCVSDCKDMANGDYQSCKGCHVYMTCSNGINHDNRPCPADLVWDDNVKRCEWESTTCDIPTTTIAPTPSTTTKPPPPPTHKPGECVCYCKDMADGNYQSCKGCNVFMTCSNGIDHDNRPCPAGLVWDDNVKRCEWVSTTCDITTTTIAPTPSTTTNAPPPPTHKPGDCVSDCKGMANGDYQSCKGCNVYMTCSNGINHDNRPCPADLVWDDNVKRCEWVSTTCDKPTTTIAPTPSTTTKTPPPPTHKPGDCVSDCKGMANGDYQSCKGCHVYMTCSNGINHDNRPCPADLVWDDNVKRCEWESTTCTDKSTPTPSPTPPVGCAASCKGKPDGDYQSCSGCRVYATCTNGLLIDNRPCPDGLYWDDNKKQCDWHSDTCDYCDDEKPVEPPADCLSSCVGMADGDYQSCEGCTVYASCTNGNLIDKRPCPKHLFWDDKVKRCEWVSSTCSVNI